MDKTGRNGLRVGDILADNFLERFNALKNKHISFLKQFDYEYDINEREAEWLEAVEYLKGFNLVDGEYLINGLLSENKRVLAEGAQGSLLDVDFGSYPFVTSSNTICAGACTGLGIAPQRIGKVFGIFKAYCTRVGAGPFPTELFDATGQELRDKGHEYGSTTGRPRRCGWVDLVALNYSIMINGATDLIMMKADVLDEFDTIKVCTGYKINGKVVTEFPYELNEKVEPVYEELPGWKCDLTKITSEKEFPAEFKSYIKYIEEKTGTPITIVSVGPNRAQTIIR